MTDHDKLPDERTSHVHHFEIQGLEVFLVVSEYPDGRPGEIFVRTAKQGSTLAGMARLWAVTTSLALQHGVPLKVLTDKWKDMRFEPWGHTSNPDIPMVGSLADYVAKYLHRRYHL